MKTTHLQRPDQDARAGRFVSITQLAFVCLTLAVAAGCQTKGYQKSDAAALKLRAAAAQARLAGSNLDSTVSALQTLVAMPSGNLQGQFAKFSAGLDALSSANKTGLGEGKTLQDRSAAYFQMWDAEMKTMNDGEIRKASAARETAVKSQFNSTLAGQQKAQLELARVVTYLDDIRKALGTDLTVAGLQSVKSSADAAKEKAGKLKDELSQNSADLDSMADRMSSTALNATKEEKPGS